MPQYVVGRDWPDRFYATNAKWPEPAQWTYLPGSRQKGFHASKEESKRAKELAEQEAARRESQRLKKQLFAAIVQRDADTVRQLLKRSPLLVQRHMPYGATPLGLAAAVGDPALVSMLLDEGVNVAEGDRVGATPLIAAAARGHTQVCQQLLASKAGGDRGRDYLLRQATHLAGETAALAAAKEGHLDTLQALLGAGADVNGTDRAGRDCFMMAAANNHPNTMLYLMQTHNVSPDRTDTLGCTALMYAAAGGAVQSVQLLVSLDPPIQLDRTDADGYTALHHACLSGSVEVMELLSSRGMALDPSYPGAGALLPLACGAGQEGAVDWLLRRGVGLQSLSQDGGSHPMFAAVRGGSTAVFDVLLSHGSLIDPRDSKGRTPLALAARSGLTGVCVHLVRAGAALTAVDSAGRVPRKLAYLAQHWDTAEALAGMARIKMFVPDDVISDQVARDNAEDRQRGAAGG